MLVADGLLALDEPAPRPAVAASRRSARPRITLRHLLQMRSGLRHTEAGDPPFESSEVRMLFLDGRDDMAKMGRGTTARSRTGRSGSRIFLEHQRDPLPISRRVALTDSSNPEARRKVVADYLQERLFEPLGMTQHGARIRCERHADRRQPDAMPAPATGQSSAKIPAPQGPRAGRRASFVPKPRGSRRW